MYFMGNHYISEYGHTLQWFPMNLQPLTIDLICILLQFLNWRTIVTKQGINFFLEVLEPSVKNHRKSTSSVSPQCQTCYLELHFLH